MYVEGKRASCVVSWLVSGSCKVSMCCIWWVAMRLSKYRKTWSAACPTPRILVNTRYSKGDTVNLGDRYSHCGALELRTRAFNSCS